MKSCLVTGGAGFIGSHLVEGLLARGFKVRILDDLSTGHRHNLAAVEGSIDFVEGSITDAETVHRSVGGCDTVFHLASLPSVVESIADPVKMHEIGTTGTLHVLNSARRLGVRRVVFAASASAYGDQPGDLRRETDQLLPLSPYAASKLAGEHYCASFTTVYGLETTRLRFFNVFGPRQDPKSPYTGVIAIFMDAMKAGKIPTIFGDGLQARDFVYVANVVEALILAAQSPKAVGKVYNIGMGQAVTLLDLVRHLNHVLGFTIQPAHAAERVGDIRHSQADVSQAVADLGYAPKIPFVDGLRRTC